MSAGRGQQGKPPPEMRAFPGFAEFRDDEGAPFYRSQVRGFDTPQATAAEIAGRLSRVVYGVIREAARRSLPLSADGLVRWHRAIFQTTFPHQAGLIRPGQAQFGIRWREGEDLRTRMVMGSAPSGIRKELCIAFDAYDAERLLRTPEQRSLRDAVTASATLYAEILRIHPFEDGNLRATFPALQGALVTLGASPVDFEAAVAEHDEALGWALLPEDERRTIAPFAELLLERMQGAGRHDRGGVEWEPS